MTYRTVVLGLLGLAACTSNDGLKETPALPPPPPPDTSAADREAALRTICEAYFIYATLENYQQFPFGEFCTQHPVFTALDVAQPVVDFACRPGWPGWVWADDLLGAADVGRVELDMEQLRACVDAAREIKLRVPAIDLPTDPDWLAVQAGVCHDFYSGTVADGEQCLDDWDCATEGSGCFTDTPFVAGSLRCAPASQDGEACSDWHGCAKDLYCADNLCITPYGNPAGGSCYSSFSCADPCARCTANDGTGVCDRRLGLGDACTLDSECATDLYCQNGVCSWQHADDTCDPYFIPCEYPLACVSGCWAFDNRQANCEASGCTYFFDASVSYGYCDPVTGGALDYTCKQLPDAGEPCLYGICKGGNYCDHATCAPLAVAGEACSTAGTTAPLCWQFLACSAGECVAPCYFDADCADTERCDTTAHACVPAPASGCASGVDCAENEYCASCEFNTSAQICSNTIGCVWNSTGYCAPGCNAYSGNEIACGTHSECHYNTGLCSSICSSLSSDADTCEAESTCAFTESFSDCEPSALCYTLAEPDCGTTTGCAWNTQAGRCDDMCAIYPDVGSCNADAACAWGGACFSACYTSGTDQPACNALGPTCAWHRYGGCGEAAACSAVGPDATACRALGACSFVDQGSCGPAGPNASFDCQPRADIGDPCSGDDMCVSGTCADDDGAMHCAESRWLDRAVNVGWLVRILFAMGGVWIVRKRAIRS